MAPAPLPRDQLTNPRVEAFLAVLRAASRLIGDFAPLYREHDLTEPQYNVLRILRGAGERGLICQEIAGRMVTRVPDVTRLVDRLVHRGLATRERADADRRVVRVRATPAGLELLAALDRPVLEVHERQFAALTPAQLAELTRLLGKLAPESHA